VCACGHAERAAAGACAWPRATRPSLESFELAVRMTRIHVPVLTGVALAAAGHGVLNASNNSTYRDGVDVFQFGSGRSASRSAYGGAFLSNHAHRIMAVGSPRRAVQLVWQLRACVTGLTTSGCV